MDTISYITLSTLIANLLLVFIMIFIERKKPQSIIVWFFILTFLPVLGFFLYILAGGGLSYKTKKMLKKKKIQNDEYHAYVKAQREAISEAIQDEQKLSIKNKDIVLFNINNSESPFLPGNRVKVFTNGKDKMEELKKDLLEAKHSIHLFYYIFANDKIGKSVMKILIQKAKEGVKVKLGYDSVGSIRTKKYFFYKLKKAGGEVHDFFPPLFGIRLINLKMNYRNHRKIAVIDGKIGYVGGVNIRDDHMGDRKKFSPWRDTHIKIEGPGVYDLQTTFWNDWRYSSKKKNPSPIGLKKEDYYPKAKTYAENIGIQIITSGPETNYQNIKNAHMRMILSAKKSVYLQTPYFVPDDTFFHSLVIAKMSGVDVNVMIPGKKDKKVVYAATLSYAKDLVALGINVYMYKGFLHAKTLVTDEEIVSIGTCNTDNRSFALNFEVTALLYNDAFGKQNADFFRTDIENSVKLDMTFFKKKPFLTKLSQAFFRIFSPLL